MGHSTSKPLKLKQRLSKSLSNLSSPKSNSSSDSEDEPDGQLTVSKHFPSQKSKSKKGKMPLFRKQSTNAKKRQQHQQYLAQENPEPVFDLSNCELDEVPSGVYALCKVLQKEVLMLNDNWLSSVHSSNNLITDLITIRVLDLHNNEIRQLPEEIGQLYGLQVLNLENNRLPKLPQSIGNLKCVQTLNVKNNRLTVLPESIDSMQSLIHFEARGNKLKELPESICNMKSLRLLDIQGNRIIALPKNLCHVRTLETLILDGITMKYPSYDICCSGTEAIMKFLCSECGLEYQPPSNFLLNVLDPPKTDWMSPSSRKALEDEENFMKHISGYNDSLEKKRQELIEVERRFAEHCEEQAQLALMAKKNRDQMIAMIAQEENKMGEELTKLSKQKEVEQKRLIDDLRKVEMGADALIQSLLDMNAKAKKTEALLDAIEEERIRENKLFEVRWEEVQNLRKKEVLSHMTKTLQDSEWFENIRSNYMRDKESSLQTALENDELMSRAQVESVLSLNDKQLAQFLKDLAKQEELQREAFEALMIQKDAKHQRITGQIALIEEELANLTVVEIEKREFRAEEEMNRLAEKRIALIELLSLLLNEQEMRQIELRKRLEEMEEQREDGQVDYWLVQFQRLMDKKPQSLIDREQDLEISVIKILNKAQAEDYIPKFARHRITIETLSQMTEDDLKQMGIYEVGVRKNILRCTAEYMEEQRAIEAKFSAQGSHPPPTAPSALDMAASTEEFTRQSSVVARGLNSECSICLDNMSEVIYMNCGHVCTCLQCCESVRECPLCRAPIVRRIKLMSALVEQKETVTVQVDRE